MTSVDFFPTILEIAGAQSKRLAPLDGVSLVPLLRGGQLNRDVLYWHYPHYSDQGGYPSGAVRAGDYKLIEFYEDGRLELYNLAKDIRESEDLSKRDPRQVAWLHQKLKDWRREPSPFEAAGGLIQWSASSRSHALAAVFRSL